jgi:hypothetical protein
VAQLVSSGDERVLESHRREVTVVFCDLRGFTAFAETAEPEEVMTVLREYHNTLGRLIDKFEGTVERFAATGSGLFNDPLPCPARRQRPCKWRLRCAMRLALAAQWRRGHELGWVGIAHGYATIGYVGFEDGFNIQPPERWQISRPGFVIGRSTARSGRRKGVLGQRWRAEPVGELELRVIAVKAFNVRKVQPAQSASRRRRCAVTKLHA